MLDGMTNIKASEVLKEIKYYTEDLPPYSPDEVAEALEMAIQALEQQPTWILVKDRLPEDEKDVLVRYGHAMMIAYHRVDQNIYDSHYSDLSDTGWYDEHDNFICSSYEVDAWMSLPAPPYKGA